MYIVVNSITSQAQQETHNYFKDQLESLRQTIVSTGLQQQQNVMNELKQGHSNMINEVKEATQNIGKE